MGNWRCLLSQEACGQVSISLSLAILSFPSLYVTHDRYELKACLSRGHFHILSLIRVLASLVASVFPQSHGLIFFIYSWNFE